METSVIQSLFNLIDSMSDPRKNRGIRHPFTAIMKLVILGLICRLVSINQIGKLIQTNWLELKAPLGFTYEWAPNSTTISRLLKNVNIQDLTDVFEKWVALILKDVQFNASVDGKSARTVKDNNGKILSAVNVFAHDLKLCLTQYPVIDKKGEPTVLASNLKSLFERYPGLRLLTGDAYYAGRNLCKAITDLGRDYLVQIKGDQPKIKQSLEDWADEVVNDDEDNCHVREELEKKMK
jgi:hypothetical protein